VLGTMSTNTGSVTGMQRMYPFKQFKMEAHLQVCQMQGKPNRLP